MRKCPECEEWPSPEPPPAGGRLFNEAKTPEGFELVIDQLHGFSLAGIDGKLFQDRVAFESLAASLDVDQLLVMASGPFGHFNLLEIGVTGLIDISLQLF